MDKLITLKNDIRTVFVGDIHGDLITLNKVFNRYNVGDTRFVFLGDYIDRGEYSNDVVATLLQGKQIFPDRIIMLLGNHELGDCGDFWFDERCNKYKELFKSLPLAVELGNIVATHGAIPILNNIKNFNDIGVNIGFDPLLQIIVWGDLDHYGFVQSGIDNTNGLRPCLSKKYIDEALASINKKILIRGHDPKNPTVSIGGKCLTLMTNDIWAEYYKDATPKIAVVEAGENPEQASDIKIIDLQGAL